MLYPNSHLLNVYSFFLPIDFFSFLTIFGEIIILILQFVGLLNLSADICIQSTQTKNSFSRDSALIIRGINYKIRDDSCLCLRNFRNYHLLKFQQKFRRHLPRGFLHRPIKSRFRIETTIKSNG